MDHLLAIRAFIRIAETGSFKRASDTLNIPRSSLTKLIQELEARLGTKLIQRTTRATMVTVEGAAYHERASRLLAELDDLDGTIANSGTTPSGKLRVNIGSVFANLILIPRLPEFQRQFPDIEIQLDVSDRLADFVEDGLDCVIRAGELPDTTLVAKRLCDFNWVTVVASSYLERYPLPTAPEEIERDHKVVSYVIASVGKIDPMELSRGSKQIQLFGNAAIAVNDSAAAINCILAGMGIGQTLDFIAKPYLDSGALTRVLPNWHRRPHRLHLLWPANRYPTLKFRVFSEWIANVFSEYDEGVIS